MNPRGQNKIQEEDENEDYDPFSKWRQTTEVDDETLKDETSNEDQYEDDEDYDPFEKYRVSDEQIQINEEEKNKSKKTKKEPTWTDIVSDVFKQGTKETAISALGTYGDLYEFSKLGNKDQIDVNPLQVAPTSKKLREVNEDIGGPGEAETGPGRYAERVGKNYGAGLAFGQINPLPAIVGGLAGEGAKDLGAGPLVQSAAEIVSMILTPTKWPSLVSSAKKFVQEKINNLRELGYTEQDITLAINSASKGKKLGVKALKGSKTEKAFENFAEHSDDMVQGILEGGIDGYEKGAKHVHQLASDAYGQVVQDASKITIKKLDPFFDSMDATMKEIKKSIGHNPEAKSFLTELTEHTLDIISNPTADNMIDFYKRLNGLGKWVGRNQKDRIITNVKESIKDTFKSEGKQGKELAEKFEKVNQGIKKAYQAEDIINIIDKASTQKGIDYTKLNKSFDKKDNIKLFEDVLGKTQSDNLRAISKVGKEVKDFDKAYKATSLITGTHTSLAASIGYLIYSGNWPALAGIKVAEAAARKLAEKSLTDPRFQNLMIRGLHAIKNESPKTFKSVNEAMQKYFDDEGINLNLSKG